MVSIKTDAAQNYIDASDFREAQNKSKNSFKQLQDGSGPGAEWRGWRDILASPNDALIEEIDKTAARVRADADVVIVCGIGGSYLGARAVIDALKPHFSNKDPEIIYVGHHISGRYLENLINYLNTPRPDGKPKNVYMNVISKSGSTLEPAIAFRVLRRWMHNMYDNKVSERIICTTGETGGALNKVIEANGYEKFIIPDDVGGRYSVLSPVGLLPVAIAGIDIRSLFYGAVEAYTQLENKPGPVLEYTAARYALYQQGYCIDALAVLETPLNSFGYWIQQLYGESEGKGGEGIFPVVLNYTTDLHSLGQMMQQGRRNVMETFITVNQPISKISVDVEKEDFDGLNYLQGKSLHEINKQAYLGTRDAHDKGGVPIFTVELERLDAAAIGHLIYMFELATAIFVYNIGQNPFDQPGVEDYKQAMFKRLGKN